MARHTNTPVNVYMDMPFLELCKWAKSTGELIQTEIKTMKEVQKNRGRKKL